MSIDEIFSKMSEHMIKGMMVHEQLMNSYLYLGLKGYAACHEYHYLEETKGHIRLNTYKIEHYDSLVVGTFDRSDVPRIVPDSWFTFKRNTVDANTRTKAIAAAYDEWINWESETKALYEEIYSDLINQGEIPFAEFAKEYILDVEEELVYAKSERLAKSSMDFDIVSILEEQEQYERSFKKKIRKG